MASILVLWRFVKSEGEEKTEELLNKERKSTLAIGISLIILSLATIITSIVSLTQSDRPLLNIQTIVISSACIFMMLFFYFTKNYYAIKLNSQVMKGDASCCLCCL